MNRRDVLKLGAVAVGAGASLPGCALPQLLGELRGPDAGVQFNATLDEQLGHLAVPGLLQRLVSEMTAKALSPEAHAKIAVHDARFRELLGTLMISQGFRELPVETQREQIVQDRMWSHAARIGRTVDDVHAHLGSLDAVQRAQVQAALRRDPDLPMALGEQLDLRAARVGMSLARRTALRGMMKQAGFRLRHGDPSVVIDELATKAARIEASLPKDAVALELARKAGERAFWDHQRDALSGAAPTTSGELPTVGALVGGPEHPGSTGLRAGAYMLGIGFALGAASLLMISASSGAAGGIGLVGLTFAVLSFSIGLIVLLVSALVYAVS